MASNLDELNSVDEKSGQALGTFGNLVGAIADSAGAVQGIIALIDVVTSLTDFQQATLTSDDLLNLISDQIRAEDLLNRLRDQNNKLTLATSVLAGLKMDLRSNLGPGDVESRIRQCTAAIQGLSDYNASWLSPFADQIYFDGLGDPRQYFAAGDAVAIDVGYEAISPAASRAGDPLPTLFEGNVFNHTYILPTLLSAICVWLTVAGSLDPEFVSDYGESVLTPAIQFLTAIYNKIINEGPVLLSPRRPGGEEVAWNANILLSVADTMWNSDDPDFVASQYFEGLFPQPPVPGISIPSGVTIGFGAIDVFSGANSMQICGFAQEFEGAPHVEDAYLLTFYPNETHDTVAFTPGGSATDMGPYNKMRLRRIKKMHDVYRRLGLLGAWNAINSLRSLMGSTLLPRPNAADWSFRAIAEVVGNPAIIVLDTNNAGGGGGELISLRAIWKFIENTPPADTVRVANVLGGGFRAILEV